VTKKKYDVMFANLAYAWGKSERDNGGFVIKWEADDIGFGELTFYNKKRSGMDASDLICESESMSEEFVLAVLKVFLNSATIK